VSLNFWIVGHELRSVPLTVPDYQTLMLPMLRMTGDGQDHKVSGLVEALADHFNLNEAERDDRLASGQRVIFNRTHWAATYLVKAGLLIRAVRGSVQITERGRAALAQAPERIDVKFLSQYPEFVAFRARTTTPGETVQTGAAPQDPEELLDSTYAALRRAVETDLLDHVLGASPTFFEQLVLDLLVAMGYGGAQTGDAARHVGRSGDDGIDGVIDEDKLGLDAVYIQAKRWAPDHPVRRPDLQAFAGSLEGQRATKGVFITTSRFTDDARQYVERISRRVVLLDGQALTRLMYDHGIGVRSPRRYEVRRVDAAYFEGEA
jgi:restriction system protein